MSDEHSTLLRVASEVGEIKGIVSGLNDKLTSHIATNAALASRVATLEQAHHTQKGVVKALAALGTLAGGVVGALTSWVLGRHA